MNMETKKAIEEMGSKKNLQEIYKTFLEAELDVLRKADEGKETIVALKEELAEAQGFRKKKDNSPDTAQISTTALKGAIAVMSGDPDKISDEKTMQEDYIRLVKEEKIDKDFFLSYREKEEKAKRAKEEIKEKKNELCEQYDKKIVGVIHTLAKEESKMIKQKEDGKEPKNDTETYEILMEIKKELGLK